MFFHGYMKHKRIEFVIAFRIFLLNLRIGIITDVVFLDLEVRIECVIRADSE